MLQTRTLNEDAVSVATEPTEIFIRHHGRNEFGKEKPLCVIKDNGRTLEIHKDAAEEFGIMIKVV